MYNAIEYHTQSGYKQLQSNQSVDISQEAMVPQQVCRICVYTKHKHGDAVMQPSKKSNTGDIDKQTRMSDLTL